MGNLHGVAGPPEIDEAPANRWRAVWWMAGCTVLFIVVYAGCNWFTAQRADVGTWYYEWELKIPFVPWMIVPYWSIDLLFIGSFFLCRGRRELDTHGRRIVFAILLAGLCFLIWPLRIAFPRPDVSSVFGAMFAALRMCDQPYNLFPSLHITLWLILRGVYVRHTRGLWQWAIKLWFVLVGLSTVLTWQHHVVDLLGGFGLAAICFYLWREIPPAQPVTPNYWVGSCYAAGSAAAAAAAFWAWPAGGILLWPAVSLGIMAAAYWGLGPAVFRKEHGGLPLSTKLLLGPLLWGQRLSLWYYRRQCRAWDEVVPGVLIGRVLSEREAATLEAEAVLDLTAEFSESRSLLGRDYRNIPILDLTAPTSEQLLRALAFIRERRQRGKTVYVHCKIGYSRSATVAGAYLLADGKVVTVEQAIQSLRAARPSIVVRPEAQAALEAFAKNRA